MTEEKDILETGSYEIHSPGNGEIQIDKLILNGNNGAKRIWKLKELSPKQVIFEIEKFG